MVQWTGVPAFRQVVDSLVDRMRAMTVGDLLPSHAQLAAEFGVSPTVVRRALEELRSLGLIVGHQGKGSFVKALPGPRGDEVRGDRERALESLVDALREQVRSLIERLDAVERALAGR